MGTYLQACKASGIYSVGHTETVNLFVEESPQVPFETRESMEQRNEFLDKINEDMVPH
jgi:hypothetical protein